MDTGQAVAETRQDPVAPDVLQSLQAQNAALRLFVLGLIRTIDKDRRPPIKEILDFALAEVQAKQGGSDSAAAYWVALEESLKELTGNLEVYSEEPSPRG